MPTIYSVSPTNGPQAGGTSVVIQGTNFVNITNIKFGGTNATFTVNTPTQITATSPAYTITGLVDVSALSTYGTATLHGAFNYT